MNHKPGSVTKNRGLLLDCHLSWTGLAAEHYMLAASVQPTRSIGRAALLLLDFAPDEVCLPDCYQCCGGLLPHHFTFAEQFLELQGCMLSVALSVLTGLAARPGCYPASCPAEPGLSSMGSSYGQTQSGSLVHRLGAAD